MTERIDLRNLDGDTWRVEVGGTAFTVTARPGDVERYGGGAETEDLLRASFRYLLDREPKSAILRSFDLTVIERYFPDYPREITGYL